MPGSYAIIIAGAGPAGLSTALHLAQFDPALAARCLVLESARHPRPKLCGGGILPDGELILSQLGLNLQEVPHFDVDWAHFQFNGRGMRLRPEEQAGFAFRTIRRDQFDAWLAQAARRQGIAIQEETRVSGVSQVDGGLIVHTNRGDFQAQVVVGADGANSVVRRAVAPAGRLHVARLLEVVTDGLPPASRHEPANSYFDFWVVPHGIRGYTWDFPACFDGRMVRVRGVYDSNLSPRRPALALGQALGEELGRHGLEAADHPPAGFPIRWFEPRAAFAAERILLVGDAAGTDALYGEGISLSLGYGRLAARALQQAFARHDFSFRTWRGDLFRSEMGKALRWRTFLARFFYRLRPAPLQAFIWHHLGWIIAWVVRRVVIGWAHRQLDRERLSRRSA